MRIATVTVMRGEVDQLRRLLATLEWADERHVVETGPEVEATVDAAGDAVVHHAPRPLGTGFDDARAVALTAVKAPWVLVVDTDEEIPDPLVDRLRTEAEAWHREGVAGVWLPRLNHVLGTPLLHSSTWPDYQMRFLRPEAAVFSPVLHEPLGVGGPARWLPADPRCAIRHHNFRSTAQFVEKLNLYSTIEAGQGGRGGRPTVRAAVRAGVREFLARYVKMRGYRDGPEGLHYCILHGMYRYLIGSKLWEEQGRGGGGPSRDSSRRR